MTLPAWILLALLLPAQSLPSAPFPLEAQTKGRAADVSRPGEQDQPADTASSPASSEKSAALANWKKGQDAMLDGRTEQAIASFHKSLEQDAKLVCNHLSLAAAYLGLGQEAQAADQLKSYLQAQPDHFVVREQYAELLLRLERLAAARDQFERFEADVQDCGILAWQQLIHCNSQLMEIAKTIDDEYARHLHRGIGLYWLARQRAEADGEDDEQLSSEGLLCQAAGELMQARRARPDEARPYWYLHRVWSCLGKQQPATRWLRAAENAATFSYLTPTEQRSLHLASRHLTGDDAHK